jgi:hypothetical protein
MTKRADATLGAYAPALDGVIDPAAVIPVEKIRAPVFPGERWRRSHLAVAANGERNKIS